MPVVPAVIRQQLQTLTAQLKNNTDSADAEAKYLDGMTNIIVAAILSATVNVTVITTGSATNQTGTGVGGLS